VRGRPQFGDLGGRIGDAGEERRHHDAAAYARLTESGQRIESLSRVWRSRLR
jgi:hypothetical protein